jgi:hypothetical protein
MPFSGTVLNSQVPFGIVPQAADVSFWADGLCTQPPGTPRTLPGGSDLAAWYNARDTSSMTIDGSDRVSLWQDRSGRSDEPGLVLPGVAGNYASAPDSAELSITGDIDLQARLSPHALTGFPTILAKDNAATGNRGYRLLFLSTGELQLALSSNGTALSTATSSVPANISLLSFGWVRVTWRQSDGRVQFFTAPDAEVPVFTQLGTAGSIAIASIFDNNAAVEVGSRNAGAADPFNGIIHRAIIRNGIDGPVVFDADFTKQPKGTTSFTEDSVNAATVTVNQSGDLPARITGERDLYQGTVTKMPVYLGPVAQSSLNTDLTTWIANLSTIDSATQFTTSGTAGVYRTGLLPGRRYRLVADFTTGASAVTFVNALAASPTVLAGPGTVEFMSTGTILYIRNADAGTTTFSQLELTLLPNTTPYLYFDGSNDFLKAPPFALSQPTTVYFVGEQVTWTSGRYLLDGGAAANSGALVQTTATPQLNLHAGTSAAGNTGAAVSTRVVIAAVFDGASSSLRVNLGTATTGNAGTTAANGLTVGANGAATAANFGNMAVSEIVEYAAAHDTATQDRVIRALARQGSIAV